MLLIGYLARQVQLMNSLNLLLKAEANNKHASPLTRWTTATGDNINAHAPELSASVMQMQIFLPIQSPQVSLSVVSQQPVKKKKKQPSCDGFLRSLSEGS